MTLPVTTVQERGGERGEKSHYNGNGEGGGRGKTVRSSFIDT